jgi:hypothetical protein
LGIFISFSSIHKVVVKYPFSFSYNIPVINSSV